MQNDDNLNLIEALKIKVTAHEKFIIMNLHSKTARHQAFETFGMIYKHICNGDITVPNKQNFSYCSVFDEETHHKVIDTYKEIFDGMFERYHGRSGDAFLEKL